MKRTRKVLLVALLLIASQALAQFEGEISMKTTEMSGSANKEVFITMFIKGSMMALKPQGDMMNGREGTIIVRDDKKAMWVISDKDKTALEIPMNDETMKMGRKAMKEKNRKSDVKIVKSGKSETILGYVCEGWEVKSDDEDQEIYGTPKLGNLFEGFTKAISQISRDNEEFSSGWQKELMKMKIFPLKTVVRRDGKVESTTEVTKIAEHSIPASTFEVPAGYKMTSLGDMGKMMQEMMKGMGDKGKGGDMKKMMEQMKEQLKNLKNDAPADSSDNE